MINMGFNPTPNISLGDMEDLFDMENELAIMSEDDTPECITTPVPNKTDKAKIIQQFMLNESNEESSDGITFEDEDDEEDSGGITFEDEDDEEDLDGITFEEGGDEGGDEGLDDITFEEDEDELSLYIDEDEQEEIIETPKKTVVNTVVAKQTIKQETKQEVKQTNTIENKATSNQINSKAIDDEEIKLLARIKAAEEQKKAEAERAERLRKLAEEARLAEEELELARKKREFEQLKLEEDRKLQQLKEQEERRIAESKKRTDAANIENSNKEFISKQQKEKEAEVAKREKLKLILERKKAEELKESKRNSINKLKSEIEDKKTQPATNYDKYNSLDIDALYREIRKFLKMHNIEKKIIDIKILEDEFGKANIKKLILKSYLISIGKGVTIGR